MYVSFFCVLVQFMVVGCHIDFGDGSCLWFFCYGDGEVWVIKDEFGFELIVDLFFVVGYLY